MAAAREAMDCSMRAWLALPMALPSAAAAAFAACRDKLTQCWLTSQCTVLHSSSRLSSFLCRLSRSSSRYLLSQQPLELS